jgi:tetratricopeptide (TPR) repeat protein
MGTRIPEERDLFRSKRGRSNLVRIYFLLIFIIFGVFISRGILVDKTIEPLFMATPTATRTANSYAYEAETAFAAGKLNDALLAFQEATRLEPNNPEIWAELSRVQVYSATLLTTDAQRKQRLIDAMASADKAVEVGPEYSNAYAAQALSYDWFSNPVYSGENRERYLLDAKSAAQNALRFDSKNARAMAYMAEINMDQARYQDAIKFAEQAMATDDRMMDVHRVNGYVTESLGNGYAEAIEHYKRAAEITPNLTFLYISIGVNYRQLQKWDLALEWFAKAVKINEQNNVKDPIPYLAIANTYSRMGEFFAASFNAYAALEFTPSDPDVYGQLGVIYFKSRNYESAIEVLKCATVGCTGEESCKIRNQSDTCPAGEEQLEIEGLPLTQNTVLYYFTYGSVLSAMHNRTDDYCDRAMDIFGQIRTQFEDDENVMSIVLVGEEICRK